MDSITAPIGHVEPALAGGDAVRQLEQRLATRRALYEGWHEKAAEGTVGR